VPIYHLIFQHNLLNDYFQLLIYLGCAVFNNFLSLPSEILDVSKLLTWCQTDDSCRYCSGVNRLEIAICLLSEDNFVLRRFFLPVVLVSSYFCQFHFIFHHNVYILRGFKTSDDAFRLSCFIAFDHNFRHLYCSHYLYLHAWPLLCI